MALTPEEVEFNNLETTDEETPVPPSKTWRLDFENGRIGGFIDDKDAKVQFVRKAVLTERYMYPIYTPAYGNELYSLIGEDVTNGYLSMEVPRMCNDCVVYDERVESVTTEFERDNNHMYVTMHVTLSTGETIDVREVINNGV